MSVDEIPGIADQDDRSAIRHHMDESIEPHRLDTYGRFRWTSPAQDQIALEQVTETETIRKSTAVNEPRWRGIDGSGRFELSVSGRRRVTMVKIVEGDMGYGIDPVE